MDGSRFDTLARAIAQSGSRRRLVSLLLALPLGGVLAIAAEAGQVVAERPHERLQRRTKQRNRKQRNRKQRNGKNDNQDNNNNNTLQNTDKPCNAKKCPQGCCAGGNCVAGNSSAQCGTGGAACQACSGSTPLCVSGSCVCSGNSCGTCQTCTAQGTCQPVTNGIVCGTSTHGGTTIRCCNGTCPDPDCVPVGKEHEGCPGPCGVNGQNCCSAGSDSGFCLGSPPDRCFCTFFDFPGMRCGSDWECSHSNQHPDPSACICGTCQVPPS